MNNTYCKFLFQESGLSKWIGNKLSPLGSLPVWLIILISSLLVTSLTEVASNPATITLLLPILSPLVSILFILFTLFIERIVFYFVCSHIVVQNQLGPELFPIGNLQGGPYSHWYFLRRPQLRRTLFFHVQAAES